MKTNRQIAVPVSEKIPVLLTLECNQLLIFSVSEDALTWIIIGVFGVVEKVIWSNCVGSDGDEDGEKKQNTEDVTLMTYSSSCHLLQDSALFHTEPHNTHFPRR